MAGGLIFLSRLQLCTIQYGTASNVSYALTAIHSKRHDRWRACWRHRGYLSLSHEHRSEQSHPLEGSLNRHSQMKHLEAGTIGKKFHSSATGNLSAMTNLARKRQTGRTSWMKNGCRRKYRRTDAGMLKPGCSSTAWQKKTAEEQRPIPVQSTFISNPLTSASSGFPYTSAFVVRSNVDAICCLPCCRWLTLIGSPGTCGCQQ